MSGLRLGPLEGSKQEGDMGRCVLCSGCQGDGEASEEVGDPRQGSPSSCEEHLHLTVWLTLGVLLSPAHRALPVLS